jgi:hypothetical protein
VTDQQSTPEIDIDPDRLADYASEDTVYVPDPA